MEYWINALLVDADQQLRLATVADELGFAGMAIADHPAMPARIESAYPGGEMPWGPETHWPDPWVLIGAMAARTERLRFATNVYVLPTRHPLVTARAVASAAYLSGDRVVLGVGVGWMAEESAALGEDFATRGARADEILDILREAFRDGWVEHSGRFYNLPRLRITPFPGRPVPVWVGGESRVALRRAARRGDGWISGRPIDGLGPLLDQLAGEREAAGRGAEPFAVAASLARPPDASTLEWATAAGVGHLKVAPWHWYGADASDLDAKIASLERFAADYL